MTLPLRATLLAAVALTAFSAPSFAEDAKPAAAATAKAENGKDYTVLKINGDDIKNSEVLDTWKGLFPDNSAPDFSSFDENIRQNVLRGIASEHLIYQQALKESFDKNPEVEKKLEQLRKQLIMQAFMEQKSKSLVTDADLHAAYTKKVEASKGEEEIRARHILVADEATAKSVAAELKKGGDFDKIAKDKSQDKGSGSKGGELGWFTKDKMVPEFADAAFKLKKDEISAPVKTAFGWHIIQVEDRRPVKLPSFEEMKDQLQGELTNKSVQTYIEDMLKKADIKYYTADGKEKELSRQLTPAGAPIAAPSDKPAKE